MEQLRKDAKRLGIWNLVIPIVFLLTATLIMFLFSRNQEWNGVEGFVAVSTLIDIPLFTFLYFCWYRFLGGVIRCFPDNKKLKMAAITGYVAVSIRVAISAIGLIMVVYPVLFNNSFNISTLFTRNGLVPNGAFAVHSSTAMIAYYILIAVMFLFFMLAAERKSALRTLALICLILFAAAAVLPRLLSMLPWIILEIGADVATLLFLLKINYYQAV